VLSPQNEFIWLTLPENAGIIPTQNAASEATYHHLNLPGELPSMLLQ
jgi:hypothetical protein